MASFSVFQSCWWSPNIPLKYWGGLRRFWWGFISPKVILLHFTFHFWHSKLANNCMNYCKLFSIYVFYKKLFKLKQNYSTSEKLTLKYYQYCMIFSVLKPNKIGQLLMAEIKNSLKEDFTGKSSFKLKTFRSLLYEINVFDKVFEISIEERNYYSKILNEKKQRCSCFQVFYSIDVLTVYLQVYQKDSAIFAFL